MTDRTEDRRGERRTAWRCTTSDTGHQDEGCGAGPEARAEVEHNGRVYCRECGLIDRRSTEGNRRRASDELAALERRIDRDMQSFHKRLQAVYASAVGVAPSCEECGAEWPESHHETCASGQLGLREVQA